MHHGVKGQKWGVRHDKDRVKLALSASRALYDSNRGSTKGLKQFKKTATKYNKKYGDVSYSHGRTKSGKMYIDMKFSDNKNTMRIDDSLYANTYVKQGKKYANGKF